MNRIALFFWLFALLACAHTPSPPSSAVASTTSSAGDHEKIQILIPLDPAADEAVPRGRSKGPPPRDLLASCTAVCAPECAAVAGRLRDRLKIFEEACAETKPVGDPKAYAWMMKELMKYKPASSIDDRLEISTRLSALPKPIERAQAFMRTLDFGARYAEISSEPKYLWRLAWRIALQPEPLRSLQCYVSRYDQLARDDSRTRAEKSDRAMAECPFVSVEDEIF